MNSFYYNFFSVGSSEQYTSNEYGNANKGGRKGDLGKIDQTKKEIHHEHLRKYGSLKPVSDAEKTFVRIKSTLDLRKGDSGLNRRTNFSRKHYVVSSEAHNDVRHKKNELYNDAIALYKSKQPVDDPSMSAMQGSILVEQRNEKKALKDDSEFEAGALKELSQDERSIEKDEDKVIADEERVDEDQMRKFGKHSKQNFKSNFENKTPETTAKEKEFDKTLTEFVHSFSPPQRLNTSRISKQKDQKTEPEEKDLDGKLREFVQSFTPPQTLQPNESVSEQKRDFPAHDSDTFPGLDDKNLRAIAGEDDNEVSEDIDSSSTPSQILGNIASIFENVNKEPETTDISDFIKKKDTIPKPEKDSFDKLQLADDLEHEIQRKNQVYNFAYLFDVYSWPNLINFFFF